MSSEDEPPQLPPRRRRNSQESLPSLREDEKSICSSCSDDLEIKSRDIRQWETDQSNSVSRGFSLPRPPTRRAASLKERKPVTLLDEYFYCEKCERSNSLSSKSFKRRSSQKKKFVRNRGGILLDKDDNYDSIDDYNDNSIYEEIDNEWLEMVRNMIAAADTGQASHATAKAAKSDVISPPQKYVIGENVEADGAKSEATQTAIVSEKAETGAVKAEPVTAKDTNDDVSAPPQRSSYNENDSSNPNDDIYVDMKVFHEDLDYDVSHDGIYETMEEINAVLENKECKGETEATFKEYKTVCKTDAVVEDNESGKIGKGKEMIVAEVSATGKEMHGGDEREKGWSAELVANAEMYSRCSGRLELSGFSEQYNTQL